MVKHRFRESLKSMFESYIDPDKEEKLQGAKTEIDDKVKRILKLIKDDNLQEDGSPVEPSKKEPLVELIEDFHNQYQSLYAEYDHLTGELKKGIKGKQEKGDSSSSSDSDSDNSSKDKHSKNGQLENEFEKKIDGLKQELEVAYVEVAELNRKMTITHEEKEDINSKYLAALSKIQEADKTIMDLKTDAEALGTQKSKLLAENAELNKQLAISGKVEAELNQNLEDLRTEKDSLTIEKETALQQIDVEKKTTDSLRTLVDLLNDEKLALGTEVQAVTDELSILKQQLEHAELQITNGSHNLKATKEANESLKAELSRTSNEVQLAQKRIQEFVAESTQLKERLDEREKELSTLSQKQKHEGHQNEAKIKELEANILFLELEELITKGTLHAQENELEELKRTDVFTRVESNTKEVNELHQKLESLKHQNSDLEVQLVDKVRENSDCMNQIQTLKEEVDRKTVEQERLIKDRENLTKQLRNVKNKNSKDEEKIRAKSQEIKQLTQEKLQLCDRIKDLEKRSAERESEFSVLQDKLTKTEEEDSAQILSFSEQIKNLQNDLVSLQKERQELAQQCWKLKLELDSMHSQKSEVEKQLRARDDEVDTIKQKISEDQEQVKANSDEISQLTQEKLELLDKIDELKNLALSESEINCFTEKINRLQTVIDDLQTEKINLALEYGREQLELQSILSEKSEIEEQLRVKDHEIDDLTRYLAEKEDMISTLLGDINKFQADIGFLQSQNIHIAMECRSVQSEVTFHVAQKTAIEEKLRVKNRDNNKLTRELEGKRRELEGKQEEVDGLIENLRNMELTLCLSNQKVRITEQLLSEKEESIRKTEEMFQQVHNALKDRIATSSAAITANDVACHEIIRNVKECANSVTTAIDSIRQKVSDECKNYDNCFSNISRELQFAKDSVRKIKEQLMEEKNLLLEELQGKKEHELILREKVEKLEAKARKEESEKMNLTTTVVELKKTVGELEKMVKEKEEGILELGEEKREAIRQLCLWIEYHRGRYDYLKDIISKTRTGQRPS